MNNPKAKPSSIDTIPPLPLDYLGSKNRIRQWILQAIGQEFPTDKNFIDVMSGSASVSHEANIRGYNIFCNDLQHYAATIAEATFASKRGNLNEVILDLEDIQEGWMHKLREFGRHPELLDREAEFFNSHYDEENLLDDYRKFSQENIGDPESSRKQYDLFQTYYTNTYFGVMQSVEIDYLRRFSDGLVDRNHRTIVRACVISAMAKASNSTTHLAQYLKVDTPLRAQKVMKKRAVQILPAVMSNMKNILEYPQPETSKVFQGDFDDAISHLGKTGIRGVVYADPPYFKEHYSRYYHVLETFDKYDYPELSFNPRIGGITIGRYRKQREVSNFGLRSKASEEFRKLLLSTMLTGGKIAISYAETSLVNLDEIVDIANSIGYRTKVLSTEIQHSGQGNRNSTRYVKEFLILGSLD
ncbi:MAG: DNA adenine methylase [Brevibacterium aurantiacum]|uniref:DNA adenine methylase n=1 Tax=Brevibacterium aurantiacum TaxID=273384 RepID=UPI003F9390F8